MTGELSILIVKPVVVWLPDIHIIFHPGFIDIVAKYAVVSKFTDDDNSHVTSNCVNVVDKRKNVVVSLEISKNFPGAVA